VLLAATNRLAASIQAEWNNGGSAFPAGERGQNVASSTSHDGSTACLDDVQRRVEALGPDFGRQQTRQEQPNALIDVIADPSHICQALASRIVHLPVLVSLARVDRAGVAAAHRDHTSAALTNSSVKGFGKLLPQIAAARLAACLPAVAGLRGGLVAKLKHKRTVSRFEAWLALATRSTRGSMLFQHRPVKGSEALLTKDALAVDEEGGGQRAHAVTAGDLAVLVEQHGSRKPSSRRRE